MAERSGCPPRLPPQRSGSSSTPSSQRSGSSSTPPPPRCFPLLELLRSCVPCTRQEAECGLCSETMERRQKVATRACCGATYHHRCLDAWITDRKVTCPGCRGPINLPQRTWLPLP